MDSALHSFVAAQYVQDRVAEASSARTAAEVRPARARKRRLRSKRRWFGRRAAADPLARPGTMSAFPPA